jgi:spore coat protein CotF
LEQDILSSDWSFGAGYIEFWLILWSRIYWVLIDHLEQDILSSDWSFGAAPNDQSELNISCSKGSIRTQYILLQMINQNSIYPAPNDQSELNIFWLIIWSRIYWVLIDHLEQDILSSDWSFGAGYIEFWLILWNISCSKWSIRTQYILLQMINQNSIYPAPNDQSELNISCSIWSRIYWVLIDHLEQDILSSDWSFGAGYIEFWLILWSRIYWVLIDHLEQDISKWSIRTQYILLQRINQNSIYPAPNDQSELNISCSKWSMRYRICTSSICRNMQNSLLVEFELYSKHSNVTKFVSHLHKVCDLLRVLSVPQIKLTDTIYM